MAISRRGFFQFLLGGVGALAASWAAVKEAATQLFSQVLPERSAGPDNRRWVMVIDLARCDGCRDFTRRLRTPPAAGAALPGRSHYAVLDSSLRSSLSVVRRIHVGDFFICVWIPGALADAPGRKEHRQGRDG